ncbi:GAF and ANTAR domain-containing protein [uncultured Jatrophihabitans sp.]|uniref:GAF and ANTAR domain-containing protein n=1 Tax=uncultured Jatrophihabitans sp. TaxID=1610747 RepID=UPI0035C985EC
MTAEPLEKTSPWESVDDDLTSALEHLRRALRVRDNDLQSTLDAVAAEAVRMVDAAEFAGVNLFVRGKFLPQATYGVPIAELDAFQLAHGIGPCIDSSRDQKAIVSVSMEVEDRWAEFGPLAARLGVHSALCVPLWVDDNQLGSLSLYGSTKSAFDERDEAVARLFALHAAIAIADTQRVQNLQAALRNRDVIGQAKGILMERRRMTADQAFDVLAQHSQRTNRKVFEIAEAFVMSGELA